MLKVVVLQAGLVAVAALVASFFAGTRGAVSVLLGGVAYALPNLLFVLRLSLNPGRSGGMTFFVGELFKLAGTIGILVVAVKSYEVHWVCLLIGLAVALKANLFAFLLKN